MRFEAFDELDREILALALNEFSSREKARSFDIVGRRIKAMLDDLGGSLTVPAVELYDVVLHKLGNQKIAVIKEIRSSVRGLGLAEAKAMTEHGVPTVIAHNVTVDEAKEFISRLAAVGADARGLKL